MNIIWHDGTGTSPFDNRRFGMERSNLSMAEYTALLSGLDWVRLTPQLVSL